MSKDSYLILGKCGNNNIDTYIGADLTANEVIEDNATILDNVLYIEGIIGNGISKQNRKVKGFLKNDITIDNTITLMAIEYPLRKDSSNTAYFAMLDLSEVNTPQQKNIEGKYEGMMFTGVKINYMDEKDIEALEIPHDELLAALMCMDFRYKGQKEFKIMIEIEKYEQKENSAA